MAAPSICSSSPSTSSPARSRAASTTRCAGSSLEDLTGYEFLAADRGLIRDLAAGKLL